ncbi:MAG: asparagine synthase (glutamine-hydrolyzing) [Deltaproteobacteria bacterium]|jgi:asparagine synthase (glutamine-hydrolysing)|nr:asparagine synthase (glutamine-hydrolyzing) [Deltaproteobacteria bacterium]
MCGISGFFNYSKACLSDEEALIVQMNEAIRHRGPDDSGTWVDRIRGVYFGHQRLSILDLSPRGRQPMISQRGTVIVYNGEVYNFNALKAEVDQHSFFSRTDTEVLLYLYEEHGHQCLNKLNGMFALAIWDETKGELFLARDRIGIKPLYYTIMNGVFAFSSEIKALLRLPWVKAELDEEALYHFLTFNKVFPPQTMFKNIEKVHPGYKMVVGEKGIKVYEPYWEVYYSDYSSLSVGEIENLVLTDLERSVQYRMVSDVPVGAFLSGGVDSSAITALMKNNTSSTINTYSIGFQNSPNYDELVYARKISKQFGTNHFEKIVTPQDILDFLPKIVDIYDEPLADATSIPIYFICQLARENGTIVVLTGDGADEIFCGYRKWMRYVQLNPFYALFFRLPEMMKSAAAGIYGRLCNNLTIYDILSSAAKGQFFWAGIPGFKEKTKHSVLRPDFITRLKNQDSYNQILCYRQSFEAILQNDRTRNYADWLCFLGLKAIVPNYYLYRADRLGMAHSIELRVPFLDHQFVELALSISGRWKIKKCEPKYILKKSLENILPQGTLYRKKQGFCVPLREWTGGFILDYIQRNLTSFCQDTGLFREKGLREQISQTKAGNTNHTFSLWNIYFLMSWFKRWLL